MSVGDVERSKYKDGGVVVISIVHWSLFEPLVNVIVRDPAVEKDFVIELPEPDVGAETPDVGEIAHVYEEAPVPVNV
jgi:hypothetical protein